MTPKERYQQKLIELIADHRAAIVQAQKDYANDTNLVNVGDIVEDHIGKLRVEKIGYYFSLEDPGCIYYGVS